MPTLYLQRPLALLGLLALPSIYLLWQRASRHVERAARLLADQKAAGAGGDSPAHAASTARPKRANVLRGALRLGSMASLVMGLAGVSLFRPASVPRDFVPVIFVLDVSASMSAADLKPSRLEGARQAIRQVCSLLPGARTALVAVAQDAAVVSPPTADREAFFCLLDQVRTDWSGAGGTRLLQGIEKAQRLIARDLGSDGSAVVVLVTDGEDHGPSPYDLVRHLKGHGVLTHTIVVGSPEGIALENLPGHAGPEPVVSKAQPERMAALARAGGGHTWAVNPTSRTLPTRPGEVIRLTAVRTAAEKTGVTFSLSPWFYLLAVALLVADRAK